jgi:hypothetical protein
MKPLFNAWLIGGIGLFLILSTAAHARVIITLKNGQTLSVNAEKADIVSITFDDNLSKAITWDFESGDLEGWTKTGTAFNTQPTYGDNPTARNRGQASNHQGNYWIGGYENRHRSVDKAGAVQGDVPQGTLTSMPFTINTDTIGFLIGGGCDMSSVRIELLVNGSMVRQATGRCTETMTRENWDVSPFRGKMATLRIIDNASGGWGHINIDEIRFY